MKNNEDNLNNKNNQAEQGDNTYTSAKDNQKQQEKEASKKVAKTAAKGAATYFAGPVGGKAVDAVAKTKAGQAIFNKGGEALNKMPGVGKAAKKLDDKGAIDAADKGIDMFGGKGGTGGASGATGGAGGTPGGSSTSSTKQVEINGSQSAKDGAGQSGEADKSSSTPKKRPGSSFLGDEEENTNEKGKSSFSGFGIGNIALKAGLMIFAPVLGLLLFAIVAMTSITHNFSDYEDALGISQLTGEDTGDIEFSSSNPEAQEFYERVNKVKLRFQSNGKKVDALKVVAVYHTIAVNNTEIGYKDMTEAKIEEIANAMFSGNSYNEQTFKNNLTNQIFRKYFPDSTHERREQLTDDVFSYIENYYSLIGKNTGTCASTGSCIYEIKGFYIQSKGNLSKDLKISDLKVRLMQSGSGSGHNYGGTWGQPLENEELVPFEKYVLGVAYQEIGPDAPDEAIKAQMVAARSYILARPFDMGGWRKIEQESNGDWVIQVAASTQDQVYCDPDKGCSATDGQWGQVHSGLNYTGFQRQPMPADHKMRVLASEVMGEVLVNNQGFIIYAGYVSTEQNEFSRLAREGYNYKQILLEVYNNMRPSGATDIQKMTCNKTGSSNCTNSGNASTGPYAGWKQYEGPWTEILVGTSGQTIHQIGCLVTSVSMLIAKSQVATLIQDFNPGTFVEHLNTHGGFDGGNFVWGSVSTASPLFNFKGKVSLSGYGKEQKLEKIKSLIDQGYYVTVEVKGNTGQHWVAVDTISGDSIVMMDPGSASTDMWSEYAWENTSELAYFQAG